MKEYGGYLPLELRNGDAYYKEKEGIKVKELNSGKAAIYYALKESQVKKIYVPFYICSSVIEVVNRTGTEVERYYINEEFMPANVRLKNEKEMILIVNYFGILYEKIKKILPQYSHVIIDNTQSFFAEPIIRKGVYNIYSCKKFIGVPDGGYLVAKELEEISLEQDYSSEHMSFCLSSIEYGTGYAYDEKKNNDERFLREFRKMSVMTRTVLENADYYFIKERRIKNFNVLNEKLKKENKLNLDFVHFVPYYYPLYLKKGIQEELVKKKVYVPILWRELINEFFDGKPEKDFSENIVFLPVDQRYTEGDMMEIVQRVKTILYS